MAITNVSGSGNVSGSTAYQSGAAAGGTSAAVTQANGMSTEIFRDKMLSMSNKDLTTMLRSPGLSKDRKEEIAGELLKRMDAAKAESTSSHAPTAPKDPAATEETDDEKRLKELLKKLKEGKITPEEMKELTGMLAKDKTATDDKPGGSTMTPRTI